MKTKYSLFLKNVFLASAAALMPSKSEAKIYDLSKLELDNGHSNVSTQNDNILTPKLLIKFNNDNSYITMGHRSHSSHSSHASHASHSSHYSSYYTGGTVETSGSEPSSTIKTSNTNTTPTESILTKNLGDRILKKGMKGTDVNELINLLTKKGYFEKNDNAILNYNEFTFKVEESVKKFQKANSLNPDGIVGSTTVLYLKK